MQFVYLYYSFENWGWNPKPTRSHYEKLRASNSENNFYSENCNLGTVMDWNGRIDLGWNFANNFFLGLCKVFQWRPARPAGIYIRQVFSAIFLSFFFLALFPSWSLFLICSFLFFLSFLFISIPSPTNPFTILEIQKPLDDVPELHKTRRSPDHEALKLRKGSSGLSYFLFCVFYVLMDTRGFYVVQKSIAQRILKLQSWENFVCLSLFCFFQTTQDTEKLGPYLDSVASN